MSLSWLLIKVVSALILPPLVLVLLGVCGVLIMRRYRFIGQCLVVLAVGLLLLLSTGAGSRLLVAPLEQRSLPLMPLAAVDAQAIVILGGSRLYAAPEQAGSDLPGAQTLLRLRYGAQLQRQTGLPLLVSGGAPDGAAESEAMLMARSLREDFRVPVKWLEAGSEDTAQNALASALHLKNAGVSRILLVTDSMHMPRAKAMFKRVGLEVIAAPTAFIAQKPLTVVDFIPTANALRDSHYALHEWIGLLWYRLKYGREG